MADRNVPSKISECLRREVGFGCPICRSPLLTYHHFDPPWSEKEHHDADGMIALCAPHHAAADREIYSKNYLRALKNSQYDKNEIKSVFPWVEKEILIRLGRCYFGGGIAVGPVDPQPIFWLEKDSEGLLLMSFDIRDKEGNTIASMKRNEWTCNPTLIHNLLVDTSGTNIRIWHGERNVGLQMSFERFTPEKFQRLLEQDIEFSRSRLRQQTDSWLNDSDIDEVSKKKIRDATQQLEPLIDILPSDMADNYRAIPDTCTAIKNWVKENATDGEGNVTILNIENLVAWNNQSEIAIRNSNLWGEPVVIDTNPESGFTAVFP